MYLDFNKAFDIGLHYSYKQVKEILSKRNNYAVDTRSVGKLHAGSSCQWFYVRLVE